MRSFAANGLGVGLSYSRPAPGRKLRWQPLITRPAAGRWRRRARCPGQAPRKPAFHLGRTACGADPGFRLAASEPVAPIGVRPSPPPRGIDPTVTRIQGDFQNRSRLTEARVIDRGHGPRAPPARSPARSPTLPPNIRPRPSCPSPPPGGFPGLATNNYAPPSGPRPKHLGRSPRP